MALIITSFVGSLHYGWLWPWMSHGSAVIMGFAIFIDATYLVLFLYIDKNISSMLSRDVDMRTMESLDIPLFLQELVEPLSLAFGVCVCVHTYVSLAARLEIH